MQLEPFLFVCLIAWLRLKKQDSLGESEDGDGLKSWVIAEQT